jgi:hypothetical protein
MNLVTFSKRVPAGLLALFLSASSVAQPSDDAAAIKDFHARVSRYLALQKQQAVPNQSTSSPGKLAEQEQTRAEKTREARPAAQQGDIFAPEIAAYFKRQIASTMRGPDGVKVRASLRHAEPLPDIHLQVNNKYPSDLPLQSTPPTLLMNLPRLPSELQYRVVGSTLVLYDVPSGLVVDLIPAAVPAS